MKRLRHFFRHVNPILGRIVIASLVTALFIEFYLKTKPAMFGWAKATDGANILIGLLLSVVGSFLYFLVSDNLSRSKDHATIEPSVNRRLAHVMLSLGNALQATANAKAATPYFAKRLTELTRNEVFYMNQEVLFDFTESDEGRPFIRLVRRWFMDIPFAADFAEDVLNLYPAFDVELTVLLDNIVQDAKTFKHDSEILREHKVRYEARGNEEQRHDPAFSTMLCSFVLHDMIAQAKRLVDMTSNAPHVKGNNDLHHSRKHLANALELVTEKRRT